MAKYIDVDLLKRKIPDVEPDCYENCGTCEMMSKEQVEDIIDSIDTVEIVRCRDCRWWEKYKGGLQGHCALHQMSPTGGWYCANGVKDNAT